MIELSPKQSDLNRQAYAQRIAPLLDVIFGDRPLSDQSFSQPVLTSDNEAGIRQRTLEIADFAHELVPDFPGSPLLSVEFGSNYRWATLSKDLASLEARNQQIRDGNRRAKEERDAIEAYRRQMRHTIGGRLLARLGGDLRGFQGNRHPLQEDQPEYEIPTVVAEPRLVGRAARKYHRTTEITIPRFGIEDTVAITETALDASIQLGEQEFDLTLRDPGPKLTIHNRTHDSEGFLSRNVVWDCYPARETVAKRESGRMGPVFVNPSLRFGYYVQSDYSSDLEPLAQLLQIAREAQQ